MKQTQTKQSGVPVAIIALVLILAVFIGWWFYNSSKSPRVANNSKTPTPTPAVVNTANAPLGAQPPNMLGSPTATVTVEEFADFQCPSCSEKHPVLKDIQSIYGSRIKFIFRHYPLPMHDKAYDAAVASEAAGIQGKFWDMQNQLYTNQKSWSNDLNYREAFKDYAQKIGLDVEKFATDMAGIQTKARVDADIQRARALNVNQTPTVYINGKALRYEDMNVAAIRQIIDADLQSANSANQPSNSAAKTSNSNANSK